MNSIRKFDKDILFEEISEVIQFYQEAEVLDDVDLDYRIKSIDSCMIMIVYWKQRYLLSH